MGFSWKVLKELKVLMLSSDIALSFLPAANIYCALVRILGSRTSHISCEMSTTNEIETKTRRFLANLANLCSNHVVCNSLTQADYVKDLPGMTNKVSTIWNGYNIYPSAKQPRKDSSLLSLIVVGRIAYPKNGVRLLRALKLFNERNGYVPRLSWAGRDDSGQKDKLMKEQMIDFLSSNPDINEQFQFLGEVSDINTLYQNSDGLILVSLYEGLPNVICEAMLNKCPIIASHISDNSKLLGESEDQGFLCDPLSPESICLAIERRASISADALNIMTEKARRFAEDNFSLSVMIDKYEQVIKNINR